MPSMPPLAVAHGAAAAATPIPAAGAVALRLRAGQRLRVYDPHGGQSGDLMAYSADGRERLSNGCTFDYAGTVLLGRGDALWSHRSRRMLTILDDRVGRHDFLHAACSAPMYRLQYGIEGGGIEGEPRNCHDNLCAALRSLGLAPEPLPTPFNLFMHADIGADGRLTIRPPRSRAGDFIELRADMDLAVAVSACPAATCNGGVPPRPLAYRIFDPEPFIDPRISR
ncbi:DUF1989 domain-containing protein [Lysobacter enzymogenes]|uniref:DUF1989 domain-containing protein n=1 Tax=Lysobacter enzymogenes TaxID=69 RepID=UPI00384EAEDF